MLYLECYPDEQLAKSLGVRSRQIKHSFSKSRVIGQLTKEHNSFGLVDEDPQSRELYPMLRAYKVIEFKNQVRLLENKDNGNTLIELCPNLESWLISSSNYSLLGLPNNANDLHKEINSKLDKLDKNIKTLLSAGNESLLYLKSLLDQIQ